MSGLKWFEYFKYLLPEESHESHLKLQERCFYISETKSDIILDYIKPNDYAHQVLSKIMKQHKQILISNTASSHLKIFLNSVEMEKYFPKGFSFGIGAHTNNKTKIRCLEKFLENKEFENIIIIGDSKSDMNLKYVAGGISYLYAHPEKPFRACDADYKINDLREILKEI